MSKTAIIMVYNSFIIKFLRYSNWIEGIYTKIISIITIIINTMTQIIIS